MTLDKPDIIIFDYGKTLGTSDGFDFSRGIEKLWEHVVSAPEWLTPADAEAFVKKLFEKLNVYRDAGCEIPQQNEMRLAYEYLGVEFDTGYPELEKIFRDGGSNALAMPYAGELLKYLDHAGIQYGIVSNINWSGELLRERVTSLFPNYNFKFIIASSDYVIRKPDPMIFELALRKAGVSAEKAWYCGDDFSADIIGAHSAGLFPVWLSYGKNAPETDFSYLSVNDHRGIIEILEKKKI